jgi:hypothetical protein
LSVYKNYLKMYAINHFIIKFCIIWRVRYQNCSNCLEFYFNMCSNFFLYRGNIQKNSSEKLWQAFSKLRALSQQVQVGQPYKLTYSINLKTRLKLINHFQNNFLKCYSWKQSIGGIIYVTQWASIFAKLWASIFKYFHITCNVFTFKKCKVSVLYVLIRHLIWKY